ncbi:DUF5641 domain-containing protein [Trichonephila clavipes]|nr:DUF5641 domain-containing protein [Trichonephila clavipes]
MFTLLCEGESVLIGRPLTYVSDDPNETTAITPAHFIQDIRGSEVHDLDITDSKHLLKRDNLRKHNSKRLNWSLGHVIELYPGKDGIERVAKLRVANGFVIRPLQKLYPLEMSVSDFPSDIALVENFPEPNKDSERLKSPEVPGPSLPDPNPVSEVSRPVKQTHCGWRIVPRQRLNL